MRTDTSHPKKEVRTVEQTTIYVVALQRPMVELTTKAFFTCHGKKPPFRRDEDEGSRRQWTGA